MVTTPTPETPLPPNVQAALKRGNALEAIKLLRAATGLGLKEAKDIIDGHPHDAKHQPIASAPDSLPAHVVAALQRGQKIEAIRLLREATGLGLKEAKDVVESAQGGSAGEARRAPGEVPRSRATAWVLACLAVAGGLAYYFLRSAA
jgi:ribosomal protein L7/L12